MSMLNKAENLKLQHAFEEGTLVEIVSDSGEPSEYDGMRLYVIGCIRDCDGTPLYRLGPKGMDLWERPGFYNYKSYGNFCETSLIKVL